MSILFGFARLPLISVLVFGGFFLGVYYFTLYDDGSRLNKLISGVQTNIEQAEAKVKTKEKELENVKEFEKEVVAEEKDIKFFLNFIPESLTYTELSSLLIKAAEFTGVNIEVKQDQKVQVQEKSDYQTLKIQLTIYGSFSQIMFFLSKLTAEKRMLILDKIDMNIDQASRLVKTNLSVIAYRYYKRKKKDENEDKNAGE